MSDFATHPDADLEQRIGRAELWKRRLIVFIAVAVTCLFGGMSFVIVQQSTTIDAIRATQQEGSPSQQRLVTLTNLIAGCVTPGQPCYENSRKQTAGAVGSINEITAITVACGDLPGEQTVAQIRACVTQQLEPEKK